MVPHVGATSMMPTQQFQWLVHELKDLLHVFETDKKVVQEYLFLSTHALEELL